MNIGLKSLTGFFNPFLQFDDFFNLAYIRWKYFGGSIALLSPNSFCVVFN